MSGGRNITDDQWKVYCRSLLKGTSKQQAAREAGISYSSVMKSEKDPMSRLSKVMGEMGFEGAGIIDPTQLSGPAQQALEDFSYFRKRYLARANSPWQEDAVKRIVELVESPDKEYLVVNAPPGSGKSTFFTHDLPCWLAVRNRALRTMIGSRTEKQAKMYSGRLRRTFDRSLPVKAEPELVAKGIATDAVATLMQDYGRFKPTNPELWRLEEFILEQPGGVAVEDKESSFVAYGMDSGFLGGRFDLVIWDDLVDKKTIRTMDARENLISWWETEAETRLDPGGLLILQGQRMGSEDLYRYALDLTNGDEIEVFGEEPRRKYHHITYKAHYEHNCTQNHIEVKPFPEGCLLDPYRLPWKELNRIKRNREERFLVLYQQEDTDPQSQLVPRLWIDGGIDSTGEDHPGCWDVDRQAGTIPLNLSKNFYSVVTADPSPSRFWAVQHWLYEPETEMQVLVDLHRAPMDAPDFLDWNHANGVFYGLLEEWWQRSNDQGKPFTYLIVEANAAQRFLLQYDHVRRWQSLRGVSIIPHTTTRNKSDEAYGVQTLAPHYRYGRVRLPGAVMDGSRKRMEPMIKELSSWPMGNTDDTVMAHWFLNWNAPNLFPVVNKNPPQFKRPSWIRTHQRWVTQ